jgi:glycosyltransferase involved in cell wall biosynthesis
MYFPKSITDDTQQLMPTQPKESMKIEAVIVCKNYSDFLTHSLPENLQYLDRVVVVTHPHDGETRTLCAKYGVDVIDTLVMHEDGDPFNKARAINLGLAHLRHDGWLLHMDADTILPNGFRQRLAQAKLNKDFIYGADRFDVTGYESWVKLKAEFAANPQFQWRYLVIPPPLKMSSRLLHNEYGYCPIGYFQLWHSSQSRRYPIINGSAEHSDVMFAVQWPRERRILLPEFFVYHLESEKSKMGANWNGRTTKPFGPHKETK